MLIFCCLGFALFPGAGRDDAYITYWPAYSLAELGELANYNGAAVEQSSSLTLVLALAALRFVTGAPLAWLGWFFGIACGLVTLLLSGQLARAVNEERAKLAPVCLALAAPFVYWSFSGMETALQALLITGWVLQASRDATRKERGPVLIRLLPWTLALCAVRPEAMFVLACVLIVVTVLPRRGTPEFRSALWMALGISAGILISVRNIWFESWLPQPAVAKAGRPLAETAALGMRYLLAHPVASSITTIAAGTGLWRVLRPRSDQDLTLPLAGLFVGAQLGFVLFSGGDWMEGARFLAPTLPLCLVLLLGTFQIRAFGWTLALVLAVSSLQFAFGKSRSLFAWQSAETEYVADEPRLAWFEAKNLVHLRDEPTLVALKQILASLPADKEPLILTGQGGLVLFHLRRDHHSPVRVVDRYGLLDRSLSSSPTVLRAGRSRLGLNLGYRDLLRDWHTIMREARLPEPDIIFDNGIGRGDEEELAERGYVKVYGQTGQLIRGSKRQPAKQVIFLKRELVNSLPAERLESFQFPEHRVDE